MAKYPHYDKKVPNAVNWILIKTLSDESTQLWQLLNVRYDNPDLKLRHFDGGMCCYITTSNDPTSRQINGSDDCMNLCPRIVEYTVNYYFAMDQIKKFVEPSRKFTKDSIRLVKRCTKPDRKEFQKIAIATAIGFCIMGFIGFFVKLIHIPINNIIVGS
ncbi:hypothetical protein KQX54_008482 [Cotesia glomerata]|uniref:Protein transport protein Sec61 subunit gamma n=2 Tax=Microgastrinae TaxID=65207 RepID=A0AAV7I6P2_COTGL|nr:hypothetical protein KQX54_008482 [Cotesia glomerata]